MQIERGQVAVVTGAAHGIGAALARAFAAKGAHVVLADVQPDALAQAAEKASEAGRVFGAETLAVPTDVTQPNQLDALAEATLARFGRVDIVCNNAGVTYRPGPIWETPVQAWHWVIDVSLFGVIQGIRSFAPHLIAQNSGFILNTASMGGLIPLPNLGPYSAAKHAIVGLTETLNAELAAAAPGVGAGVLCPGLVATDLSATSAANTPSGLTPAVAQSMAADGVMTADELATRALAGIAAGRLHIITHPDRFDQVRLRLASVSDDLVAL